MRGKTHIPRVGDRELASVSGSKSRKARYASRSQRDMLPPSPTVSRIKPYLDDWIVLAIALCQ
ncbi:MAG: hypothetical protein V7L14_15595 [Nostoc sp.]|uniref:hypothetical protein n=1 Tax=Nostoc sp. TaxID=1180 RepID=UPI002FFBDFDF